jgi:hypothetical protein
MNSFEMNEALWAKLMLEMPFSAPGGKSAEDAATKPGNCVKSNERGKENGGFPKYHGRLLKYGDECVVLGHNSPVSKPFIWSGSQTEYHRTWIID